MYSLRGRLPGGKSSTSVATRSFSRIRARMRSARPSTSVFAGDLDADGQRRLLSDPLGARPDHDDAGDRGREFVDDFAHRGGKDIDAAHDQHVVGAPDAADPRRGASAGATADAHAHVVAGAEAQQRRRAVDEMGQHEFALGPVGDRLRRAGLRIDQLDMDEAAAAEMHALLFLALAPEGNGDVADAHRLDDARAPGRFELGPHRRLTAAGLARHHHPFHARLDEVHAALARPFGEMQRIGGRQRHRGRFQKIDRRHQALGVPRADRDDTEAEALERVECRSSDERTGVVGRDDALAARDSRGCVRARRRAHPDFEIGGGERNEARRPGRAAGRIDARDLVAPCGQMGADRLFGRTRGAQLVLFGQRHAFDRVETADRPMRRKARALELAAIEARALEEIFDLLEVERRVGPRLILPRRAFDVGLEHRHHAAPVSAAVWATASSPFEAR